MSEEKQQQPPSDPPPPQTAAPSHPHSSDYAPYPHLQPDDVAPPPESWTSPAAVPSDAGVASMPRDSNPYVASPAPPPPSSVKKKVDSVKDVLGQLGKKAADATKKAEDLAGNVWQHLKTGPSTTDAVVGRIAQGTKVLSEGGYEKIFRKNFETAPEEKLLKTYSCYLSTSAGPVMGTLYLSTAKLAFCSDNPLSFQAGGKTEWSFYKVVIPFHQLKAVNPSTSKLNPSEKFIQVISVDNHEFWFMGFVYYDSAVKELKGALPGSS